MVCIVVFCCLSIELTLATCGFTEFHNFVVFFRTAGLPQYGQLGHGTDNEVCSMNI